MSSKDDEGNGYVNDVHGIALLDSHLLCHPG